MAGRWSRYRGSKFWVPLWKRSVPRYPLYWKGDPQYRQFLPLFWMKMTKPPYAVPKDSVVFEVHPQMTKMDVKQYLEKIYGVDVLDVKVALSSVKNERHPLYGFEYPKGDEIKRAFVKLKDTEFEFPDLFKENKPPEEKMLDDYKKVMAETIEEKNKFMDRLQIPSWFR